MSHYANRSVKYLISVQCFPVWQKTRRRRRRTGQLRLHLVTEFARENYSTSDPEKTDPNPFTNSGGSCVLYSCVIAIADVSLFLRAFVRIYYQCATFTLHSSEIAAGHADRRLPTPWFCTVSCVFVILANSGIMGCCGSTQVRHH